MMSHHGSSGGDLLYLPFHTERLSVMKQYSNSTDRINMPFFVTSSYSSLCETQNSIHQVMNSEIEKVKNCRKMNWTNMHHCVNNLMTPNMQEHPHLED